MKIVQKQCSGIVPPIETVFQQTTRIVAWIARECSSSFPFNLLRSAGHDSILGIILIFLSLKEPT